MATFRVILSVISAAIFTSVAYAQWPTDPTAGTPRLSPDLKAAPPRLPDGRLDLSGMWQLKAGVRSFQTNIAGDITPPLQPWAAALYEQRKLTEGRQHPRVRCLPRGVPNAMMWRGGPFKFVHTPGVTFILYEEFVTYRQVFTDGRPLPTDAQPAWWGYSIGRWEKDAFIIETAGLKDGGWLDFDGHPATDAMRITERFSRPTVGELQLEVTFNDSKAYTGPWSVTIPFNFMPDAEFIEHVCENEHTYERLSGK